MRLIWRFGKILKTNVSLYKSKRKSCNRAVIQVLSKWVHSKNRAKMPANCWLRCKVSAVRLKQPKMSCVPCKSVLAKRQCKSQISQQQMCQWVRQKTIMSKCVNGVRRARSILKFRIIPILAKRLVCSTLKQRPN